MQLGFNDVWHMQPDGSVQDNPHTLTPSINRLMSEGIKLTAYHTYKVCAPSRAAIMTGRYPWGVGYYDMKGPEAIPLGFKLVSNLLVDAGYETHAIGKWNLGSTIKPYTPTHRGFSTFFGYYAACQVDYWYHGAGPQECGQKGVGGHDGIPLHVGNITDLSNSSTTTDIQPARGFNGTYNEEMFTAEAERLIAKHAAGLRSGEVAAGAGFYLYLAYHNVHGATNDLASQQAPKATVDLYNTTKLDTYKVAGAEIVRLVLFAPFYTKRPSVCSGQTLEKLIEDVVAGAMITKLDDGVGAVRAALEQAGMFSNSVIAFCSDNGGPLDHATNLPLRGGKHTLWDGGLRVTAWVSSPLFHPDRRGTVWDGLMYGRPLAWPFYRWRLSPEPVAGVCRPPCWQAPCATMGLLAH